MATWSNISLQEANSPIMEQLIFFHDHALMILAIITTLVTYLMMSTLTNKYINRFLLEGQTIELVWTILPAATLIFIALPSLRLLYLMDEMNNPEMTVKAIGHQWYWTYEYTDFKNLEFDSYMKPTTELMENEFRLLEVDNRTVLPMNTKIRLLVTATDVLHSWAMPSLGVKVDATPGRLNQMMLNIMRPGLMYGQCSEICGANHSFMPIVIESIPTEFFVKWLNQ